MNWTCQHCTFVNPATKNPCEVCCKSRQYHADVQEVDTGDHSPTLAAALAASQVTQKREEEERSLSAALAASQVTQKREEEERSLSESQVKRTQEDHRGGTRPPAAAGATLGWGMPEDAPLIYDDSVGWESSPGMIRKGAHAHGREGGGWGGGEGGGGGGDGALKETDMIHVFVSAVTAQYNKADLQELIREAKKSDLLDVVNAMCYRDVREDGRTPLAYAVVKNLERVVRDLIDLGANVNAKMGKHTALTIAATNQLRDNTEMFRLLLSMGANPSSIADAGLEVAQLNRTMKYWLERSKANPPPDEKTRHHLAKMPPLHRLHEIKYALIGQGAAITTVEEALSSRFGNQQGRKSPLVLLLLGPPGHGKTCISRNIAKSLVGDDNYLEVTYHSMSIS
jgi:ATP-dependent Clp protease ATP-binding subunit ClpA